MTIVRMSALGLVLALPAVAAAGERPRSGFIEAGGFLGWHNFSTDNELGAFDNDARALDMEPALGFGVRLGWAWTAWLALEGELALYPTVIEEPVEVEGGPRDEAFAFGWRAHAVVSFLPGSRVRPFVLAGGGALSTTSSDTKVILADTDALFHAGAGLKVHVRESWGIRADARGLFPPTSEGKGFTFEWELLVGIYGEFTGPKPPAPPAPEVDK